MLFFAAIGEHFKTYVGGDENYTRITMKAYDLIVSGDLAVESGRGEFFNKQGKSTGKTK